MKSEIITNRAKRRARSKTIRQPIARGALRPEAVGCSNETARSAGEAVGKRVGEPRQNGERNHLLNLSRPRGGWGARPALTSDLRGGAGGDAYANRDKTGKRRCT